MTDPSETIRRIEQAHAYRAEWDRRWRRLERAYHGVRRTGQAWQALGVAWLVYGLAVDTPLPVVALHWIGCLGLAMVHGWVCYAIVSAEERLCDEMAREAGEIATYLGRG